MQLINAPDTSQLSGLLYRALLAVLIGCRLRVKEASALTIGQIQQQPHGWVIVHADAKTPRSRITPMPAWVKVILDQWLEAAGIGHGHVFRCVNDHQVVVGDVFSEGTIKAVVARYGRAVGIDQLTAHSLRTRSAELTKSL